MNRVDPALQDEIIFIAYDDVIRSTKFAVLKKLIRDKDLREEFKDKIDFSMFENKTDDELLAFIIGCGHKDILEGVALKEFNYFESYVSILVRYPDILKDGYMLSFATAIQILLQQKFTKKIYIYFKYNDSRVFADLQSLYDKYKDRIIYVTGELTGAIKNINETITLYVFNDIDMIQSVVDAGKINGAQILIADYGYNYMVDDELNEVVWKIKNDDDFQKENNCILRIFPASNNAKFN